MSIDTEKKVKYFHGGKFLQADPVENSQGNRAGSDRRQTITGDQSKSGIGKDRRVGARRLEDVIITMEITDPQKFYSTAEALFKIVDKNLKTCFDLIARQIGVESLINIKKAGNKVVVETKMKFRDKVKQVAVDKGLSFEVTNNGIYLSGGQKTIRTQNVDGHEITVTDEPEQKAVMSSILGFNPENLKSEIEMIIFKVFVKCLKEVHPVAGDHERDALKQNVSLEQKIIFIAGKHYPKSEKYNYQTIVGQVFDQNIKAYNDFIHLKAEITMQEERFKISNDHRLKIMIQSKIEEMKQLEESSLEETVKTLYLYLDYFRNILKVGAIREKIERIFDKVNEKQIQIINLSEVVDQLQQIVNLEEEIKTQQPGKMKEYLSYIIWVKNEINKEVDFTRNLWINNIKGKAYISNAVARTHKAISL